MNLDRYDNLHAEMVGSVLRITLDRPDRHNALSDDLVANLVDVLAQVECDRSVSVIVFRGAGKSFCSGYDVTPTSDDSVTPSPVQQLESIVQDNRLFEDLWQCPIPTIAQIHGYCLAAGTDLALACDLLVCATDARIGYPAVRSMGVPATHMWLYHLGPQWTKRLLLTGDSISGGKAAKVGLAIEAVEPDELDQCVLDLATRMALIPRDLLVANKRVVNSGVDLMGRRHLQQEAAVYDALGRHSEGADSFWATARAHGVKQAISERDGRFADGDPIL